MLPVFAESWLTNASGGSGSDYFVLGENPVLTIDFGSTQTLNTILFGASIYSDISYVYTAKVFDFEIFDSATNAFVLVESALDLEDFNPEISISTRTLVEVSLSQSYTTSKVRLTITDNYYGFDSLPYIDF